jgi:5-methylcytosine-specific restriction endonuclease McrBC GTP-binding regulatory subunit McrB
MSYVLAIGAVRDPGYVWRRERAKYKHTINVDWDTNTEGSIEKQPYWAFQTVLPIPVELAESFRALNHTLPAYTEPSFNQIVETFDEIGFRIAERKLRQYHLSLKTRGFVILAGPSGTGKTWLATAYANAIGAEHAVVSVAPNWTSNEDLLGYYNPVTDQYHHSAFSTFITEAAATWHKVQGIEAQPFHLILDEMNLARIEYYFASFLSAMETRMREGSASLQLGPGHSLELTPNLKVIGTVNIDETTHGFADKVYDRAQLIELDVSRNDVEHHLRDTPYATDLLAIWEAVHAVGIFAFRVLDEIAAYVEGAEAMDVPWDEALDEQILQKILPKIRGADQSVELALERLNTITDVHYPLSHARVSKMLKEYQSYGIASYFS